jgi:hypothetical protein
MPAEKQGLGGAVERGEQLRPRLFSSIRDGAVER